MVGRSGRDAVWLKAVTLLLMWVLISVLAACSSTGAPTRSADPRADFELPPTSAPEWDGAAFVPRGPFYSAPLHLGVIPEGEPSGWIMPQALGDEVEMKALLLSATDNLVAEASAGAWKTLLDQAGVPYDWVVASTTTITPEVLVREDGVGRYQAVLLSTSNLVYFDGTAWPSALSSTEWDVLFNYERAYGVRQATLFASPYSPHEDYGVTPVGGETPMDGMTLTATAAGRAVFTDLGVSSVILPYGTTGFPSSDPQPGTTPLLTAANGDILAVHTNTDGRERVAMLYNNPAWGVTNTPAIYTQQIGPSLLRWALGGVHIGEKRNSYQADVDDWFSVTGLWDVDTAQIVDDPGFAMSAQDAYSLVAQQNQLRAIGGGIASDFTWSMAFNGSGADVGSVVDCALPTNLHTLSSMTRCLAGEFWWVNHTWTHAYMDYNPPHVSLDTAQITTEISLNDGLASTFGLTPTYSGRSLVTGDISGLGWYDPLGPEHEPVQKEDFGLNASSPYLLEAAVATGKSYLASNMSTPSHEPDCWSCGIVHPMDPAVFLVPRYPTNLFATVTTPAAVTQAYNIVYPPGTFHELGYDDPLTYEQILDIDTDIALGHLLAGSPYPHYFHIPNFYEYEAGRSTLFDWTEVLLGKYASMVNEPLLTYMNDQTGDYVLARTQFLDAGVSAVWDRATGLVTLTSAAGGPVFLTGASLGGDATNITYNGRTISQRSLAPGQTIRFSVGGGAPAAPVIESFTATPAGIDFGDTSTLGWNVTGAFDTITIREAGGGMVATLLQPSGTLAVTPAATTTYELVVARSGGAAVTASTVVTVTPPEAPAITFSADPTSIVAGGSSELHWSVTGAYESISLRVQGGAEVEGGLPATGSHTASPATTTTYELVVTWTGGAPIVRAATVAVTSAPVEPSITFGASPATITAGQGALLSWTVTGTSTSIVLREKGGAVVATDLPADGSRSVGPLATTTYELVAAWPGGEVVRETTVTVETPPVTEMVELTLTFSGSGLGVVIASPAGQACVDDCSATVPAGTTVTLTAVPLLGSTLGGFTGACTGQTCSMIVRSDVAIDVSFEFLD